MSAAVVEELGAANEGEWDAFVRAHPEGCHYQRAGWARVFHRAFGRRPLYRLCRIDGEVAGVLPLVAFASPLFGRFLVSVPFLNRGGILADGPRAREALLEEARRLVGATRSAFCELRRAEGGDAGLPVREGKVSMSLPLADDPDVQWKVLPAKVRNLVRKAGREGLVARPGDPARDLDAFYDVFARNMRDLGTPVYSARFFREIFREFPGDAELTLVESGGATAAAGIRITHGPFTEMHWAASRREMLRFSPNMLLYWECIADSARRGLSEFCFGRSTEGSGPHRFKRQWGAEPTPLRWEYLLADGEDLPALNPDNPRYRLAIRAWQRLPLPVTRALGPSIVRHLP